MPDLAKINLIKKLYYDEDLSAIEIGKKLKTTPWAILSFMRRNGIARRSFKEANQRYFKKKPLSFLLKEKLSFKDEQLKIAGIMLYWAEGGKGGNNNFSVDFCNSDPEMIKIFLKFLREICGVNEERLRVLLYCYADQEVENLKNYWYKITNIPLSQFTKPYIRNDFLFKKSGKMKYGLVHIRYCDKKLLFEIQNWIRQYLKEKNIWADTEVVKPGSL